MTGITEKIIKPCDCLLALAIPLTRNDFFRDLQPGVEKDFAKLIKRRRDPGDVSQPEMLWEMYVELVELIQRVITEVEQLGVKVVCDLELENLHTLFADHDVITFVSHWQSLERRVEFYDGLHTSAEIIAQIPLDFRGIIDLTICNSVFLGEDIKQDRRRCLVGVNRCPATLQFRLLFYKYLMKYLSQGEHTFPDATVELRKALFQKTRRKNF